MATLAGLRCNEETARYLRDNLDHWDLYGYGIWAFKDRENCRLSLAGLRDARVGGNDEVEVACALVAEYWIRGLAAEIAKAILEIAVKRLGIMDVVCLTLPTNLASRRVMEKAGVEYERDVLPAASPQALYRITAAVSTSQ